MSSIIKNLSYGFIPTNRDISLIGFDNGSIHIDIHNIESVKTYSKKLKNNGTNKFFYTKTFTIKQDNKYIEITLFSDKKI